MTTPQLLAKSHGITDAGDCRCFYCAAPCGDKVKTADRLSDTFVSWNLVARPESPVMCAGCDIATRESVTLEGYYKPQRTRTFSWVITEKTAKHYTKANRPELIEVCLEPPVPPFAIVISDSGKKHLIYRAPVSYSREVVSLQLEEEKVVYRPAQLAARLNIAGRIAAAAGKPSLSNPLGASAGISLSKYYKDFEPLLAWWDDWQSPVSRLAAWLVGNMEDSRNEHVTDITAPIVRRREVAAVASGFDGPGLFG